MIESGEMVLFHRREMEKSLNDLGMWLSHANMEDFWNDKYHRLRVAHFGG